MQTRLVVLHLLQALVLAAPLRSDDAALRAGLEKVYHDWRSALINKDMEAWRRSTALYRQVVTRNLIVSGRQPYPDSIFDIPIQPPEITKLRLLECEVRGATAHLIYFGRIDLGLDADEIPDNILILNFINENGSWKFDTSRFMNLADAPEVRAGLQNGAADFLDRPEFSPAGVVLPVPAQCREPDYMALLQIQSYGYETKAILNGFDYPPIADNAVQQLVIGGLMRGRNALKVGIKALPVEEGAERLLEINAVIVTGAPNRPQIRVFSWEHKSATPPAEIELPILVTPATLRGV